MNSNQITSCRLPMDFGDLDLAADLAGIEEGEWVSHFNTGYHDGGWSGVALRASGGDAQRLDPDHSADPIYADTPLLARCPNLRAILLRFECAIQTVRLLRLGPGGVIREHRDYGLSFENGIARVHVPILTSVRTEFFLDSKRVAMAAGECWYLNFDLPHRVQNLGATDRIHLVVDCEVNDWLAQAVRQAWAENEHTHILSSMDAFHQFSATVFGSPDLMASLSAFDEPHSFVEAAVSEGSKLGFDFTLADVEAAMQVGARAASGHSFKV